MRNSVLSVLGEMVVGVLGKEDLDEKDKHTRDQFLDKLEVRRKTAQKLYYFGRISK